MIFSTRAIRNLTCGRGGESARDSANIEKKKKKKKKQKKKKKNKQTNKKKKEKEKQTNKQKKKLYSDKHSPYHRELPISLNE
jgi:Sec-independent protein translocase protein TatA